MCAAAAAQSSRYLASKSGIPATVASVLHRHAMPSWTTGHHRSAAVQIFFCSSSHFIFGEFAAAKPYLALHLARSSQVTNHGSRQTRNMARPSRCYSLDPPHSYRGSPKDDFSLEPTRPSTWLIAETDSSRTGTRNSCFRIETILSVYKVLCKHKTSELF